jgi:two-component system, LuxR family, response regulator FixJ
LKFFHFHNQLGLQARLLLDPYQCGTADNLHARVSNTRISKQLKMKPQPDAKRGTTIIAVVDDDPAVCNSLKFSLELEGFVVQVYRSAAELLATDHFHEYGCFVIDQRMPEMSGMELIAHLRERKVATPAILIVSHLNAALSARAANAHVPIVEKPLLNDALVEKIREACRCG